MLCECGCGKETKSYRRGFRRFVAGHQGHLNKGIKFTEDHKLKIRKATKGIINKGKIPWNKGKKGLLVAWNKGTVGVVVGWSKGKKRPEISGENGGMYGVHRFGEDSPHWKGGKKLSTLRKNTKRRELGFNPLNKMFDNSEPHHINNNDVIWIPVEWNQNIKHNLKTGKNMEIINTYAYFFILQQNIKQLGELL